MPERRPKPKKPPLAVPAAPDPPAFFPVVGIGASAGGIAPFLELLQSVGTETGMAFVYVLHQEKHDDHLAEVVARATLMPVIRAEDGIRVVPDRVYVAPSDAIVTVRDGRVVTRARGDGREMPIDQFFHSLAEDQGGRAIAVVLSGADSDGALGCKAIKAEGGITFAQDESARFPQMPHAAVTTGAVDFVMSPAEIGAELLSIVRHLSVPGAAERLPEKELSAIFRLLQKVHDVDFTHYKPNTVERRIRRRMALHKIDDPGSYITLLRDQPRELEQLYGDILIRVTGFFRDPDVFDALARNVIPALLRDRGERPIRVWVAGCSTGEEAYSFAIALLEATQDANADCGIQIFGTDVSEAAIDRARIGSYPESIAADVPPERLRRFFVRTETGYRVARAVRDCCVFARQNLTRDPPFSRLDLISCRNVMIYLGSMLQRKILSIFHYALLPHGYLVLGNSETIGSHGDLFAVADRRSKIYRKKAVASHLSAADFEPAVARVVPVERVRMQEEIVVPSNVFREADRVVLSRYSPPAVLIDENLDVLQFRGRTSLFLEPAPGVASFNILKMAREGLLADLRAAIYASRKQEGPVRRERVRVKTNGDTVLVNLEVLAFVTATGERYQLVLFETGEAEPKTAAEAKPEKVKKPTKAEQSRSERLERELEATREYLQSIIEEQEAMNEELRSANEEIQSSNEELQSTNEELETAKEELQSSNEELTTLNEELANRNDELAQVNNDLLNLLASMDVSIVMLDSQLRIRRFNPGAQRTLNLIPSDVGRPIADLKTTLVIDDLEAMIAGVIDNLEVREQEVQDRNGHWYSLRVRPYKTTENKIDGAVLVLVDVDQLKKRG